MSNHSDCTHDGDDPVHRNLDAVRTGAMVHDAGSDAELLRLGLIRVNGAGWYDLTPLGRAALKGASHVAVPEYER